MPPICRNWQNAYIISLSKGLVHHSFQQTVLKPCSAPSWDSVRITAKRSSRERRLARVSFNPIFRPDRAYRIDNLRCVFCSENNKHAAMLGASDLADYPASEVLAKHLDEIRFDDCTYIVILKTFSNYRVGEGLFRSLQPTRFINIKSMNIKSMTFQPAIQQGGDQVVTARDDQVTVPADINHQTIGGGWTLQTASIDSGNPAGAGV